MTTLFLIFAFLVIAHFILESIIAPSERCKVRLDLFALRDEIRLKKIESGDLFDADLYEHMQAHANKSIHLLHNYGFVGLYRAYKLEKEKGMSAQMEGFYELLHGTDIKGLTRIHIQTLTNTAKGMFLNSIGWLPYLVPPLMVGFVVMVLLYLFMTKIYRQTKEYCGKAITVLLEMPEHLFDRFFPPGLRT